MRKWFLLATGILTALLGGVLTVLGLSGAQHASERAAPLLALSLQLGEHLDPSDWQRHWELSSLTTAAAGGALVLGGIAIALRKRWGFLILGSTLVLTAAFPWMLKIVGMSRYPYETVGWVETLVLLTLAFVAFCGFTAVRRMAANENT
jgi:hypothetical protein